MSQPLNWSPMHRETQPPAWQSQNPRPSEEFPRTFYPSTLESPEWSDLKPLVENLLERKLTSKEEFETCIKDFSEFQDVLKEEESRLYIEMTGDTANEQKSKSYLHFVEHLQPKLEEFQDQFFKKILPLSKKWEVNPKTYKHWFTSVETTLSLFTEKNLDIQVGISKLSQDYQKLVGSLTVDWEGKPITLSRAQVFSESPDRNIRESSWRKVAEKRLETKNDAEVIFNQLFEKRNQIAQNLGLRDFRDYCFKKYERTDYNPAFCETFHQTVQEVSVPIYTSILEHRKKQLKVDTLRPWDLWCDPMGRPSLKPFKKTEDMVKGVDTIIEKIDPALHVYFKQMQDRGLLDLENRVGKAPGGYQCSLDEIRYPFIFMNAVGSNSDIFTLLHEGGHSFHYFLSRHLQHGFNRVSPMEFCEVASMSMELLGLEHLDVFYTEKEQSICKLLAFEEIFRLLNWITIIDKFQHWMYTRPNHSPEEREEYWCELMAAFQCGTDWTGLEKYLPTFWLKQPHLFEVPFYYIEYGIAQLGALQVWMRSLKNKDTALADYKKAMTLGGTLGLKDLFSTCGLDFGVTPDVIEPLLKTVYKEWEKAALTS